MSTVLQIRVQDEGDLSLLMLFLKRLNIEVTQTYTSNAQAIHFLEKLAGHGGIKSIADPVAWQREMREDKPLTGRE